MYDSLQQSPIYKKVLFISESSVYVKKTSACCSLSTVGISMILLKKLSSLEIAINGLPVILIKFLVREDKAKESKKLCISLLLVLCRTLFPCKEEVL